MIVIPPEDPNERRPDPAEEALGQLYDRFTNVQNLAEFHAALRKRDALYDLQHQEMGDSPQDYENLHPKDFFNQFHRRADEDDKAVVSEAPYRIRQQLRDVLAPERDTAQRRATETYKKLFIDRRLAEVDQDRLYYLGKIADAANDQDRERYVTALIGRLKLSGDVGLLYKEEADRLIENIPSDLDIFSFNREFANDPALAHRLLLYGAYPNIRPELRESLLKDAEESISNLGLASDQAESGDSRPNGARAANPNIILPVWRIPPEGLPNPKGLEQTLPDTPPKGLDPTGLLMLVNATDSGSSNDEARAELKRQFTTEGTEEALRQREGEGDSGSNNGAEAASNGEDSIGPVQVAAAGQGGTKAQRGQKAPPQKAQQGQNAQAQNTKQQSQAATVRPASPPDPATEALVDSLAKKNPRPFTQPIRGYDGHIYTPDELNNAAALIAAEMTSRKDLGTERDRFTEEGIKFVTTTSREGRLAEGSRMAGVLLTRLDRLRQGKATVNGQTINIPPGYYGTVNGRKPQNLTDIVFARSGGNQFVAAGNQKFNNYLSGKPEDPEALALARFAIEQAVRFGPETTNSTHGEGSSSAVFGPANLMRPSRRMSVR
jgi:hypothetical protein